jgi:hypothetical protein
MLLEHKNINRAMTVVKTLAVLVLLQLAFPFNLALTSVALLRALLVKTFQPKKPVTSFKTILISGGKMTKALQLARSFHQAGHRVILIESKKYWLTGHRFSWDIARFYTVPNPDSRGYAEALLDIVKRENVDVYIPVCSPVASYYDALAKQVLSPHCEVIHVDADMAMQLDDKYEFWKIATSLRLSVPDSYYITDPQKVLDFDFSRRSHKYILKSIAYDSVRRLDLTLLPCDDPSATQSFVKDLPVSEKNPWIMQAFVLGQEYCTHSTVRDGELRMHCCCKSSGFQVNYEMVHHPEIEAWVKQFVGSLGLTGQVSFDFMQALDGTIYAIECNPRTHSAITMFYNHPHVSKAYLDHEPLSAPIQPLKSSRPTYWLYHELWRFFTNLNSWNKTLQRVKIILNGKDAIFDWEDPLPFLMVHHLQIPLLLLENLIRLKGWIRIDFNIGKLVESAGD